MWGGNLTSSKISGLGGVRTNFGKVDAYTWDITSILGKFNIHGVKVIKKPNLATTSDWDGW